MSFKNTFKVEETVILISFFILLLLLAFIPHASADNLLLNPSFESGNKNAWRGEGQVIKGLPASGNYSVRIHGGIASSQSLSQPILVTPGGLYRFSGQLATWKMTQGSYQFHVHWYDRQGVEIEEARHYFGTVSENTKYHEKSADIIAPLNAASASFKLHANQTDGIGFFDALSVTLIKKSSAETTVVLDPASSLKNKSVGAKWRNRRQIVNARH